VFLTTLENISPLRLWTALSLLVVARVGLWAESDIEALRTIAQSPFDGDLIASADFRARNWLGPVIAGVLGLSGHLTFFLFHVGLGILLLVVGYLVVLPDKTDLEVARGTVLLLAAVPGMALPFFWVGNDSVTLLLLSMFVLAQQSAVGTGLLGVLIGLNHFEHGIVAIAAFMLWKILRSPSVKQWPSAALPSFVGLVGVGLGRLLQNIIFHQLEVGDVESRAGIALLDRSDWSSTKAVFYVSPLLLWSFLGLGIVIFMIGTSRDRWASAVSLLLISVPAIISFDQTRVFLVTSLPIFLGALRDSPIEARRKVGQRLLPFVTVWCLTPWIYMESWKIAGSATPYSLAWLLDHLTSFEMSTFPR